MSTSLDAVGISVTSVIALKVLSCALCCALLFAVPRRPLRRDLLWLLICWQGRKNIKDVSKMSQPHDTSSSLPHGAQGPIPSRQDIPANSNTIVVLSSGNVRPVKPARIINSFQDQVDRAILTPTSSAEAGPSDPGRRLDGTCNQTPIPLCAQAWQS